MALGLGVFALVLSGCSSDPGHALPSTGTPQSTGSGAAPPKIANPLPSGTLDGDPCAALTSNQVIDLLGVSTTGKALDSGVAKTCHWANLDRGSSLTVQFVYAWRDGLGHVYTKKNEGFFQELEPIQGYPVVAYGQEDGRPTGRCSVAVGVADNAAFEADVTISRSNVGRGNACDSARRIGNDVVTTLKSGA
jgi:hypothetical protein